MITTGTIGLLEQAVDYSLDALDTVRPEHLSHPTPCRGWDLCMLLAHASDSVAALHEGLDAGRIGLYPVLDVEQATDPSRTFRWRMTRLLDVWSGPARRTQIIKVAGQACPAGVVAGVAALEIAIHGWDITQASGHHRPIPPDLALALLAISPLLMPDGNRHPLFASPVAVSNAAGPSERLLGFLGRAVPRPGNHEP